MLANEPNDFLVDFDFGSNFVKQVGPIEGIFEKGSAGHAQVFQDIVLDFWGGGGGKCDDRCPVNFLNNGTQTAVFRPVSW